MLDTIKKLKFRGKALVLDAPKSFENDFRALGFTTFFDEKVKSANTLVFVTSQKEFLAFLKTRLKKIESDGILWFAYPKGASKIKSDINRDLLWKMGEEFGITSVAIVSLDDTWSALRFRPIDKVGK